MVKLWKNLFEILKGTYQRFDDLIIGDVGKPLKEATPNDQSGS